MSVQRWSMEALPKDAAVMAPYEHGDYVTYADHVAALAAAVERERLATRYETMRADNALTALAACDEAHAECICHHQNAAHYIDGVLQSFHIDGVEFISEQAHAAALAEEYNSGYDAALRSHVCAEVATITITGDGSGEALSPAAPRTLTADMLAWLDEHDDLDICRLYDDGDRRWWTPITESERRALIHDSGKEASE